MFLTYILISVLLTGAIIFVFGVNSGSKYTLDFEIGTPSITVSACCLDQRTGLGIFPKPLVAIPGPPYVCVSTESEEINSYTILSSCDG